MDTNNLIRLTNKALSNKYNKEDGKVYLVIFSIINNKILTTLEYKQTVKDYINYLKQIFKAYGLIHKANI